MKTTCRVGFRVVVLLVSILALVALPKVSAASQLETWIAVCEEQNHSEHGPIEPFLSHFAQQGPEYAREQWARAACQAMGYGRYLTHTIIEWEIEIPNVSLVGIPTCPQVQTAGGFVWDLFPIRNGEICLAGGTEIQPILFAHEYYWWGQRILELDPGEYFQVGGHGWIVQHIQDVVAGPESLSVYASNVRGELTIQTCNGDNYRRIVYLRQTG